MQCFPMGGRWLHTSWPSSSLPSAFLFGQKHLLVLDKLSQFLLPSLFSMLSLVSLYLLLPIQFKSQCLCKASLASLLKTCPYHLTPLALSILSMISSNPNISISSSSISFTALPFQSFSRLQVLSSSNTMFCFHRTLLTLHSSDK